MKNVYVFFADGFEEIEALTCVDVLKRAGVNVTMVATSGEIVHGAHDVPVICDKDIDSCDFFDADMLLLPGGMPGTTNLAENEAVCRALTSGAERGISIAAICAAPMVLGKLGLLKGRKATCYPGFEKYLDGCEYTGAAVQEDGGIITGKGPGVSLEFALAVAKALVGKDKVHEVRESMMCPAK